MDVLYQTDDRIQTEISLYCTVNQHISPSKLRDKLISYDSISAYKRTNRAMYPNEELCGISFSFEDLSAKGKIKPNQIKIYLLDITKLNRVHERLTNILDEADLKYPELSEYIVSSLSLRTTDDDIAVTHDFTKANEKAIFGEYIRNENAVSQIDTTNEYTQLYFNHNSTRTTISDALKHLEYCYENEIFLVIKVDEVMNRDDEESVLY